MNKALLPVDYIATGNAWMTGHIFQEWFQQTFGPAVRKHLRKLKLVEKTVLLLDNCPAHPPAAQLSTRDGKITVLYLPKKTTSNIQPLDQRIIANFKINYRRQLVRAIVDDDKPVTAYLKSLTLKDAIYMTGTAWRDITESTILNCWMHALTPAFKHTSTANEIDHDSDYDQFLGFTSQEVKQAEKKLQNVLHRECRLDMLATNWPDLEVECPTAYNLTDDGLAH